MNPVVITASLGLLTVALGCVGLLDPPLVMGVIGIDAASASARAAVLSEVRAVYGGIFIVMGLFTLLAAFNPAHHRARLTFIALLWLGLLGGRLFGMSIDGFPGFKGWIRGGAELAMGVALLLASRARSNATAAGET
jgi:hypothetical protein